MLHSDLLRTLRCPETRQTVALAETALIGRLNELIASGRLRNRGGQVVTEKIEGGLVRADGRYLYPIREETPIMLIDEAIPLQG